MLQIDRVHSEVELVPGDEPPVGAPGTAGAEAMLRLLENDPGSRARLRSLELDVLHDELRELQRRGRV